MLDKIKDYIGWWIFIPCVMIVLLQVPGCVLDSQRESIKQIQIMTQHCASQGKTYLQFPSSSGGQCI